MPKMCRLAAPGAIAQPVFVNPLTVRYVRPGSPGNTLIAFADDQSIGVAMPIDQVIELLDTAMNAASP